MKKLNLEKIWSGQFWEMEAERIELEYWSLIKNKLPNVKPPKRASETEHRIEKFVRELSRKTKIGNLHVGLTSSDLEDNIRALRLEESLAVIYDKLLSFIEQAYDFVWWQDANLVAYTHLLPASYTTLSQRMMNLLSVFKTEKPMVIYKGIGGAVGDGKIQKKLKLDLKQINERIFGEKSCQEICTQTGDHKIEFDMACWISWSASCFARMANDFRQMFAFGQATHTQQDIGSTALAHKKPNPWRYESASGKAELLYDLPSKIARIASSCLLERTLTNQSALNHAFKEAFFIMEDIISDVQEALKRTKIVDQTELCKDKALHSEEILLRKILTGMPRLTAHQKINQKYGQA